MAELAVGAAIILAENVLSFIIKQVPADLHKDIEDIKRNLEKVEAIIIEKENSTEGNAIRKNEVKQLRDVAYESQDVLEEFMLHLPRELHDRSRIYHKAYGVAHSVKHWIPLRGISSKIKVINNEIKKLLDGSSRSGSYREGSVLTTVPPPPHILDDYDQIIGFEKLIQKLTDQLIDGPLRVDTIAVHGPAGSGKSVLVKKVFESKRVRGHFDCYAWIYVSRSYNNENLQEIISNMLHQFCASREEPIPYDHGHGADTSSNLKYYLNQKRYLLVLDNVWRREDWESLKNTLPVNIEGSKIIITTRHSDLASSCVVSHDRIHHLTCLPFPEDWRLFCNKAFRNDVGSCPPELKICSEKIVRKCEGLPLAIVALGGLLSYKPPLSSAWEDFYDSLGSKIAENPDLAIINKTLLPSYKDLSISLKSCFLYFSIFPGNYSIKRGRLIRLWVAEHFVRQPGGRTPEEVAEDYLNQLISRNVIHVSEMDYDGRVRTCRAGNIVLEFLIQKSKEENFVVVDAGENDGSGTDKIRRLSIHNPNIIQTRNKDLSCVRSMISFKWVNLSPSEIHEILRKFEMLRVLDLEDAPLEEFPKYVLLSTLLRYLSLRRTRIKSIPKSIEKLPYLETLDLRQTCVTKIPKEIWKLHNLRHLLVYPDDLTSSVKVNTFEGVKLYEGVSALTKLQKLSLVKADEKCVLIKELGALIQLKKLGLVSIQRKDGKELCASIEKMENLITLDLCSSSQEEFLDLEYIKRPPRHLQRLYLKGRLEKLPSWIVSLCNLIKIHLKWSRLRDNPLAILQDLPNLMELVMLDSYTGQILEFEVGKFKKLKALHIEQVSWLHTMIIQQGSMPDLQKLSLSNCANLKMLPAGIEFLSRVEEFLLYDMHANFIARLEKNSEDREMVNHILVIHSFTSNGDRDWKLHNLS